MLGGKLGICLDTEQIMVDCFGRSGDRQELKRRSPIGCTRYIKLVGTTRARLQVII